MSKAMSAAKTSKARTTSKTRVAKTKKAVKTSKTMKDENAAHARIYDALVKALNSLSASDLDFVKNINVTLN